MNKNEFRKVLEEKLPVCRIENWKEFNRFATQQRESIIDWILENSEVVYGNPKGSTDEGWSVAKYSFDTHAALLICPTEIKNKSLREAVGEYLQDPMYKLPLETQSKLYIQMKDAYEREGKGE